MATLSPRRQRLSPALAGSSGEDKIIKDLAGHISDTPIRIRNMKEADLDRALTIKELAGWNQVRKDWQTFLRLSRKGCFVAVSDGLVVGTGTTLNFNAEVGWIAMLLVDPKFRRMGVGTRLLNYTMNYLQSCAAVKLDATPQGRILYSKAGFKEEFEIVRLCASRIRLDQEVPEQNVLPITRGDIKVVSELDMIAFGANRQGLVEILFSNAKHYAWKAVEKDRVGGFVLGRNGGNFDQIGPIITGRTETAMQLLKACVRKAKVNNFIIDAPVEQKQWLQTLLKHGFAEQRAFIRMCKGQEIRGNTATVYATAGPDLGVNEDVIPKHLLVELFEYMKSA